MESTAPPARCEITRLPDNLLSATLGRTAPLDACRAAAVSPAFRAAADADAVWFNFLPRDLPPLADGELPADPQFTKKQLFMRLSDHGSPVLLADGLTSMWLDTATGAKCYMLEAIRRSTGAGPPSWASSSSPESRRLPNCGLVWWLEIRGEIDSKMLSRHTTYSAHIVFSLAQAMAIQGGVRQRRRKHQVAPRLPRRWP